MKQTFINIRTAIKRGIISIFPSASSVRATYQRVVRKGYLIIRQSAGALKVRHISILTLIATTILLISCVTPKQTTQLVYDVSKDTIYINKMQYDSIYIYQEHYQDRSRDTLYVKDKSIEYRYKLLRDTIFKTRVDSIPYEVTITEVKEITRPLTWFDHLTRLTFWFLIGFAIAVVISKARKVFNVFCL